MRPKCEVFIARKDEQIKTAIRKSPLKACAKYGSDHLYEVPHLLHIPFQIPSPYINLPESSYIDFGRLKNVMVIILPIKSICISLILSSAWSFPLKVLIVPFQLFLYTPPHLQKFLSCSRQGTLPVHPGVPGS